MKPQKRADPAPVTARPRSLRSEARDGHAESGLSIEPEEMGQSFLRYATESGQELEQEPVPELHADSAPPSDEPLDGSNFSSGASIWEATADLVTEHGDVDAVTDEALPAIPDQEEDADAEPVRGVLEVDLTKSVIDEASLLDEESSVLGETVPKQPRTDDARPSRR